MSFLDNLLDEEREPSPPATPQAPIGGSILAVDIGNVHTRAILLDVVDGQYRFVSRGEAPTTDSPPWNDIHEGVRNALNEISMATGRRLMDERGHLIHPEQGPFEGVSIFVATASAGQPIKAVMVGLVPDVSLASGQRAAESTYLQLSDTFSLADTRSPEQQIDALIHGEPDMIMMVGGTDGGAEDSMRKQMHMIGLAVRLIPHQYRPVLLYAGNHTLQEEVKETLGEEVGMRVEVSENVRPSLDVERLDSAQRELAYLFHQQKSLHSGGFGEIGSWTADGVEPTAHGFSKMTQALAALEKHDVLGVDLGSASTTVAASIQQLPYLNVFPNLGVGHSAQEVLDTIRMDAMGRWLTFDLENADQMRNYIYSKTLFPHSVPAERQDLEIEYAMAREIIRRAVLGARNTWRGVRNRGLLPTFGTLLLSGGLLTRAPSDGWSTLIAMDALLPVGITRLLLDPYGLAPSLGSIAMVNPTAVVQALDGSAFIDLGTVISISGRARKGEVVLRGSLKPEGGQAEPFEVRYGTITTIPLERGVRAELSLQPRLATIAGERPGRRTITGGELGLIVDARGRPWRFPRNAADRHQMLQEWITSMTGEAAPA